MRKHILNILIIFTMILILISCGGGSSDGGIGNDGVSCTSMVVENEELILDGKNMPAGWFHASDPDLVKIDNQWHMFFTSIRFVAGPKQELCILAATLPVGMSLDADVSNWSVDASPVPVISPGTDPADWDYNSIETVKYIKGYDNTAGEWVERIYYLGYKDEPTKNYQIGFVQKSGASWNKHPGNPVLSPIQSWEFFAGGSFLGDQTLYYEPGTDPDGAGGVWHMYYQAVTDDPALYVIMIHATSSDGITWAQENRSLFMTSPPYENTVQVSGPYHIDIFPYDGSFYFNGWIPDDGSFENQGLWLTKSSTPDGSGSSDFEDWALLLKDNGGPSWRIPVYNVSSGLTNHDQGLFGSTIKEENGRFWLFYHAVQEDSDGSGNRWARIGRAEIKCLP